MRERAEGGQIPRIIASTWTGPGSNDISGMLREAYPRLEQQLWCPRGKYVYMGIKDGYVSLHRGAMKKAAKTLGATQCKKSIADCHSLHDIFTAINQANEQRICRM